VHTKFTNVEEFKEELGVDKPHRNIVRLTNVYSKKPGDPITQVRVRCTYIVKDHLVLFEKFCGSMWPADNEESKETEAFAQEVQEKIKTRCEELGYEVRAGFIEE
jgi:hypothetical protein